MNPLANFVKSASSQNGVRNALSDVLAVKQAYNSIKGGNINETVGNLLKINPQFRQFYELNKDKSVEQIASDYGIDLNLVREILK